jgi:hypothetical protein
MRRLGRNVKRLARPRGIWHRGGMTKDAEDSPKGGKDGRAARLREALRSNLRRRKGNMAKQTSDKTDSPSSAD